MDVEIKLFFFNFALRIIKGFCNTNRKLLFQIFTIIIVIL